MWRLHALSAAGVHGHIVDPIRRPVDLIVRFFVSSFFSPMNIDVVKILTLFEVCKVPINSKYTRTK
jgi:hypothetical protein